MAYTFLLEYSEKTINNTIERWTEERPDLDPGQARDVILRFDQVKSGLSSKLATINLSDELKQGNNYLNIDKYSLNDMIRLLRSLPEKDDKIKKEAIAKFVEKERLDKPMVQSYVARFMDRRRDLKYSFENGTEDEHFTKEEVGNMIPKRLQRDGAYLDPRNWEWTPMEALLDALFPRQGQVGEEDSQNTAETDADKVYDKNGLEVYKGDAQHKCVSYNPTVNGRKAYSWCIAQPGNSNYDHYRFQSGNNRMFYICFDRSKPNDDSYHAFVIHVGEDNKQYWITDSRNSGDKNFKSWGELSKIAPSVWPKLEGLESVFKYIAPSKAEISSAALRGKKLTGRDFVELDYDTKEEYVRSNAGSLNSDVLNVMDKELKNLAINYGQKFTYKELSDSEQLAKRYAVFRFRHTNYSKEPIPLPFVKYLDEPAKEKYLATFDDNLTFEYIARFFGEEATQKYVAKQLENLDYLPASAEKFITDPKLKAVFSVYVKLFSNWTFGRATNISEDELMNKAEMPRQEVDPKPFSSKQWSELAPNDKKVLIGLAKQTAGKEKYTTLLYALPFVIENDGQTYVLAPVDINDYVYNDWVLLDGNDKVVQKYKGDSTEISGNPLIHGYPDLSSNPTRIYKMSDIKSKGSVNEIVVVNPLNRYKEDDVEETELDEVDEIRVNGPQVPQVEKRGDVYYWNDLEFSLTSDNSLHFFTRYPNEMKDVVSYFNMNFNDVEEDGDRHEKIYSLYIPQNKYVVKNNERSALDEAYDRMILMRRAGIIK